MENRADIYGVGLLEKGKHLVRQISGGIQWAAVLVMGFLLSNVVLPGSVSPFGLAYSMAAPAAYRIPAIAGAAMGYLFHFAGKLGGFMENGFSGVAWRYLLGIPIALAVDRGCRALLGVKPSNTVHLTGVFGAAVLPWLAAGLFRRASVSDLVLAVCQGGMAAGACWLFQRAFQWMEVLPGPRTHSGASPRDRPEAADIVSVLLTGGLLFAALSRWCIGRVSVGRVLALAAVLVCSCRKTNSGLGAAAGVTAGVLAALCGPQRGLGSFPGETLPGIWGIGGLLAGMFAPLGRGFCCAAMLLGETASVFLFAQDERTYILLAEALAASVLFLMLPAKAVNLAVKWLGGDLPGDSPPVGELLLNRLRCAGAALADIARTTEAVSERLAERELPCSDSPDQIYRNTVLKVCRGCSNGMECWAERYSDSAEGMSRLHQLLQRQGGIAGPQEVSACFPRGCCQPGELAIQAERDFREHLAQKEKKRVSTRVRGVVTDQFEGLSMVMDGMEQQLRSLSRASPSLCGQLAQYCEKNRMDPFEINCYETASGRLTVELVLPFRRMERIDKADLAIALGEVCERDFDMPQVEAGQQDGAVRLRFRELPSFRLETGSAQLSVSGSRICGDSCSTFQDEENRAAMLISDGMGTGARAAMDSAMASGLFSRLLCAGIAPAAALKLVNGALLVKSDEESLATLDLANVDLYTGKAEFFKAGAAPTFLRRGGHAGSVEAASLPAGILNNVAFEHAAVALRDGDLIIMVSDGAVQNGADWIGLEAEQFEGKDVEEFAERLAKRARARMKDGKEDDITVLVGMLVRCDR